MDDIISKVDKTYEDLKRFVDSGEYEYAAMLTRTIVEIIVKSYSDQLVPSLKELDPPPTIMDQIKAISDTGSLSHNTIYNLHEMRKLGNIGSHQGKTSGDISIQVRAMVPVIGVEIDNWKSFLEGSQFRIENNTEVNRNISASFILSLVCTIIGSAAIIGFSLNTTISYVRDGLNYDDAYLLYYWICILGYLLLACAFRKSGIIQRIIFDCLTIYFVFPRLFLIIISINEHNLINFIVHLFIAIAIICVYSVICSATAKEKGGGITGINGK